MSHMLLNEVLQAEAALAISHQRDVQASSTWQVCLANSGVLVGQ